VLITFTGDVSIVILSLDVIPKNRYISIQYGYLAFTCPVD